MKTLYIIRGLSGKGKTTLARSLCPWWHPFKRQVAADDMPGLYDPDGKYVIELQQRSHQWCQRRVINWMQQGMWAIAVHN